MDPRNNQSSYSLKKTIGYLENVLTSGRLKPGDRIPSTRTIAAELHVSLVTIQQAVNVFVRQKKLVVKKKSGTRLPFESVSALELHTASQTTFKPIYKSQKKLGWQRVAEQLQTDIMNGIYYNGNNDSLPSIKEMESTYKTCFQTMKKAIVALTDKGVISNGKKIALIHPSKRHGISTIVLVTTDQDIERKLMSTRGYMLMRSLEIECRNINVHLEIVYYSKEVFTEIENIKKKCILLGIIIDCLDSLVENMVECVRLLQPLRLPLAVIDHGGIEKLPIIDKNIQVYTFGSISAAGRDMARHIIPLGHTKAAFLTTHHGDDANNTYSRRRYTSFKTTFESVSEGHNVLYLGHNYIDNRYYTDNNVVVPVSQEAMNAPDGVLGTSNDFLSATNIQSSLMKKREVLSYLQRSINGSINFFMSREAGYYTTKPLFELALTHSDITVWICEDDFVAIDALCYLKSIGKRVPQDISVAGFEDNDESFHYNLTTYNFNMPTLISRCLRFIQYPSVEKSISKSNKPMEIVGHVIERKTTGFVQE